MVPFVSDFLVLFGVIRFILQNILYDFQNTIPTTVFIQFQPILCEKYGIHGIIQASTFFLAIRQTKIIWQFEDKSPQLPVHFIKLCLFYVAKRPAKCQGPWTSSFSKSNDFLPGSEKRPPPNMNLIGSEFV